MNTCPLCGGPAYVGLIKVECENSACANAAPEPAAHRLSTWFECPVADSEAIAYDGPQDYQAPPDHGYDVPWAYDPEPPEGLGFKRCAPISRLRDPNVLDPVMNSTDFGQALHDRIERDLAGLPSVSADAVVATLERGFQRLRGRGLDRAISGNRRSRYHR